MYNPHISFANLHIQFKQANPYQIGNYRLSLQLHKIFNDPDHIELANFANQIISTRRQTHFEIQKTNKFKIGLNTLSNKLYCLNNQIELNILNLPFYAFKNLMKTKYLIWNNSVESNY